MIYVDANVFIYPVIYEKTVEKKAFDAKKTF
jgi:predicted nucleic acid-binding protein